MKISELILKLQEKQKELGDVQVLYFTPEDECYVEDIYVNQHERAEPTITLA